MILFDEINGKPLGSGISKTFILDEKIRQKNAAAAYFFIDIIALQ